MLVLVAVLTSFDVSGPVGVHVDMTTLGDAVLTVFSVEKLDWQDSHEYSPILQMSDARVECRAKDRLHVRHTLEWFFRCSSNSAYVSNCAPQLLHTCTFIAVIKIVQRNVSLYKAVFDSTALWWFMCH